MKLLIKQACLADSLSPHNGQVRDLLIENGIYRDIAPAISEPADQVIDAKGAFASPGWVDIFANFADPGYEYKETLETGAAAAAAGGYTDVFTIPDTKPVVDSKSPVEYIIQKSQRLPVNIRPIGAITRGAEGKQLAEMYDMYHSGAVAFSDGLHPVQTAGILLKALQYVRAFDGVLIQIPDDITIGVNGLINEGIVSTRLGLPGKPMMAEELTIARDIKLARYTGSRIHFTGVTSPKSLEYIRRGKDGGTAVTCSVSPAHLIFADEDLADYDTNLKVYPPLRDRAAVRALREAVLDGTIDCIASHHLPHEFDSKIVEFEYAKFGMSALETAYAAVQTVLPDLSPARVAELFGAKARSIFALPAAAMIPGEAAVLTLFDPSRKWTYDKSRSKSKSANTPFHGRPFRGKALGIVNHGFWTPNP